MDTTKMNKLLDLITDYADALLGDGKGCVLIVADPSDGMIHWMTNLHADLVPQLLRSTAEQAETKLPAANDAGEASEDGNPIG